MLSTYAKVFENMIGPDEHLVFSFKTSSKVIIDDSSLLDIKNDDLSSDEFQTLTELGIIVDDVRTEKQEMLYYFNEINLKNTALDITIVLNLDCNFDCPYCYEKSKKGNFYMDQKTADQTIKFIKKICSRDVSGLSITFTGGEPLLSTEVLKYISTELKKFIENKNGTFGSALITNGSLFTYSVANELNKVGLDSVKITLNGIREIHNQNRPFKSGDNSFDVIINNVKNTCDLTKITISGNYEEHNYQKFRKLLDYLVKNNLGQDKLHNVVFNPIMDTCSPECDCYACDQWALFADMYLKCELSKHGFKTLKIAPVACMAEFKNSYVINYNGDLYECPGFVGTKEYCAGNIWTGIKNYTARYKMNLWKNNTCLNCYYLPLCWGGCKYISFLKYVKIKLMCQKEALDATIKPAIMQELALTG